MQQERTKLNIQDLAIVFVKRATDVVGRQNFVSYVAGFKFNFNISLSA